MASDYRIIDNFLHFDRDSLDVLIDAYPSLQRARVELSGRIFGMLGGLQDTLNTAAGQFPGVSVELYIGEDGELLRRIQIPEIARPYEMNIVSIFDDVLYRQIGHLADLMQQTHLLGDYYQRYMKAFLDSTTFERLSKREEKLTVLELYIDLAGKLYQATIDVEGSSVPDVREMGEQFEPWHFEGQIIPTANGVAHFFVRNIVRYLTVEEVVEHSTPIAHVKAGEVVLEEVKIELGLDFLGQAISE
jgi:hypothetical protein